jgi:hypothetical protein
MAVIRPFEAAEYEDNDAQIITDLPPCFTLGIKHSRFLLPWAFSKHKSGLMLGTMCRTTQLTILRISNHPTSRFYVHTISFSPFSVVFSNESLTNCSSTVDVEFPKLPSDYFCGNRVFKINNNTLKTGSFKLFKRPFPGILTILTP